MSDLRNMSMPELFEACDAESDEEYHYWDELARRLIKAPRFRAALDAYAAELEREAAGESPGYTAAEMLLIEHVEQARKAAGLPS
jgi:hypothetical protein